MEIIKNTSKWGNGAGVVLPRNWVGKQVKIILIDRTEKIKEEVLDILKEDLEEIMGIYLVGSYSRGEEEISSDIDIIAISNGLKKEISSGKYNVSIYPINSVKQTLNINPILIYPRILEAKTILNNSLLYELEKSKLGSNKVYRDETKRIIKINEGVINLSDKKKISDSVIYSLILRLRGILLIKKMDEKKVLTNKDFLKFLSKFLGDKVSGMMDSYKRIKNNLPEKEIIDVGIAKDLLNLLKEELKNVK